MQQTKTRQEQYRFFLDFVTGDSRRERRDVGRRMFNIFLWCFVLPTLTLLTFLILLRFGVIPRRARNYMEWVILVFPVCYSLYVLGQEVLRQLPRVISQGGVASTLEEAIKESQWRERIGEGVSKLDISKGNWSWILSSYRIDLERLHYRTKYLTAFAAAIFYFLIKGVDLMGDTEPAVTWVSSPMGLIDASSSDINQLIGLFIFLALFYLSGSQTYHSLKRYLDCAELFMLRSQDKPPN